MAASHVQVYDAKMSTRTKLHLLRTVRDELLKKPKRYEKFKSTVFEPWLDIRTKEHDNHLIHCLLQHQRYIKDATTDTPFIFDIGQHTLEFGRREFCLMTGFHFGNSSLTHLTEVESIFSERIFPGVKRVKGKQLMKLFTTQGDFNNLSDDDAVRVCLVLVLDFVFIGNETKQVTSKEILKLVDDFSDWDRFPWGDYIWKELHKRVYNHNHRYGQDHLDKIAQFGPAYLSQYTLQGFVFPFKIWLLETFPNAKEWWLKEDDVIPRSVAWCDKIPFLKSQYNSLSNVRTIATTLYDSLPPKNLDIFQSTARSWWVNTIACFSVRVLDLLEKT